MCVPTRVIWLVVQPELSVLPLCFSGWGRKRILRPQPNRSAFGQLQNSGRAKVSREEGTVVRYPRLLQWFIFIEGLFKILDSYSKPVVIVLGNI